ncbi:hypothetical protein GY45DRAFT_984856 [Cubamyces sp. BRFM 1775]|nr:hypothetical protein GY45DRAFT_984856 [Cubamyces sp. BRFM 1775]
MSAWCSSWLLYLRTFSSSRYTLSAGLIILADSGSSRAGAAPCPLPARLLYGTVVDLCRSERIAYIHACREAAVLYRRRQSNRQTPSRETTEGRMAPLWASVCACEFRRHSGQEAGTRRPPVICGRFSIASDFQGDKSSVEQRRLPFALATLHANIGLGCVLDISMRCRGLGMSKTSLVTL